MSQQATDTSRAILELRERNRQRLGDNALSVHLLEYLFEQPVVTVRIVEKRLRCSFATANKLVDQFDRLGLLKKVSRSALRNRRFRYEPYLALFEEAQTAPMQAGEPVETAVGAEGEKTAGNLDVNLTRDRCYVGAE